MNSLWIPLPFPACSRCQLSWVRCYHRDCSSKGEILVEPYLMQAKCDKCQRQWPVMQTSFHCSCGYVFDAHSVSEALSTASLMRLKLIEQIQNMDKAELRIRQTFSHSFTEWLNEMSFEFGFAFGTIAAYIKKWLDQVWSDI